MAGFRSHAVACCGQDMTRFSRTILDVHGMSRIHCANREALEHYTYLKLGLDGPGYMRPCCVAALWPGPCPVIVVAVPRASNDIHGAVGAL